MYVCVFAWVWVNVRANLSWIVFRCFCVMSQCVAVSLFYDCVSVNVFDCVGVGISCRLVIVILCEGERVCECACECVGVCVT